mmetsp:Transcript_37150/g.59677  ORF Transcript_37150/g.59677 Transcript_37150/m.59677 type:complete len:109 (+) Transcript_37150:65-391(+)
MVLFLRQKRVICNDVQMSLSTKICSRCHHWSSLFIFKKKKEEEERTSAEAESDRVLGSLRNTRNLVNFCLPAPLPIANRESGEGDGGGARHLWQGATFASAASPCPPP